MLHRLAVDEITGAELQAVNQEVTSVYQAAFSGPPWCEDHRGSERFARRLGLHLTQPGFTAVVARRLGDDAVVGFGYGYTSFAGNPPAPWYDQFLSVLEPDLFSRHLVGAFELVELAVLPRCQGEGIGGRLHDHLLALARPARSWLLCDPEARRALALYRQRGWREIARPVLPDRLRPRLVLARTATVGTGGRGALTGWP